ncbi:hypothetical protein [Flyfo microvirus Tbat2_83]|nr:hypothetical protein [Flyfo microvirus Tbat2_83]
MTVEIAVWQIFITLALLMLIGAFQHGGKRSHKTVERKRTKARGSAPLRTRDVPAPSVGD